MTITRIQIGGEHAYQVVIGTGVLGELPALVGPSARTVVVVHPQGLGEVARPVCGVLTDAGYAVHGEEVPAGEAAKTVGVAAALWSRLAGHRLTRSDAIVGVGGGATTDLAGFVAATWLRGVRLILVPTTLLAVVDAAIGGKTAVNIEAGKNLVGAFHPPAGVLTDLAALESLSAAEYVSGLAEVIKAGFIADPAILDLIEADPAGAVVPHGRHARELVERVERYQIRHGEAVAIGMVYAAELARLAGRLDTPTLDRHRRVLAAVGLPTSFLPGAWPALRETMAVDKKSRGGRMRFVVLDGLARQATLDDPPEDLMARAYEEVAAR